MNSNGFTRSYFLLFTVSVVTPKFIHRCSWKGSSLAGDSSWRLVLKLCTRYLKYDWEDANCSHLRKWRLTEMMENYSPLRWPLGSTKGQSQSTRSQERGQHSWPGLVLHSSQTPQPINHVHPCLTVSMGLEARIPEHFYGGPQWLLHPGIHILG